MDISPTSKYDATGSGSADNGLGTPEVDSVSGLSGISDNTPNRAYVTKDNSSGEVKITVTESAKINITVDPGTVAKSTTYGEFAVNCSILVDILDHAHPCNMRELPKVDWGLNSIIGHVMDVHVKSQWDSTGGKVSQLGDYALPDLSNCFVGEYVTFSGDSTLPPNPLPKSFYPKSPPFASERFDDPTISGVTGSDGMFVDNFTTGSPKTPRFASNIYRFLNLSV